ncbi:MAG: hypothetical protein A3I02_04120 [Betaproteobacteria bacterium RIFCSPLOWO2_02_FULL_67_26]|nr:MAG: hypothetical protein A3I02_04120 [Betaproteobacteria bacterium RIFCSPLOWO2_02_FULL_67_26]
MKDWTELGLRGLPSMSARSRPAGFPPFLQPVLEAAAASAAEPLVGISVDGKVRRGLFPLRVAGVTPAPMLDAAQSFLAALDPEQRAKIVYGLEAGERRTWYNIHPYVFRHGLMLEGLAPAQRKAALRLMETTLSARGFAQARDIMRLNALLIEVTGKHEDFGEWPYFLTFFGLPSADAPWGWQIDGHHLNLNFFVLGDRLVFTPSFMGSEPCRVTSGPLAGTEVFVPEAHAGLALVRSLDAGQSERAVLRASILPDDLPPGLRHPVDGRMAAGAFKDNAVIPYAGVRADALSDAQRRLLVALVGTYVGWARDGHAAVKMTEVEAHLDETHFAWMGATSDEGPFYYRVQSPVVLVEFDHHPGIVFDNLAPSHHHVHTIIRTPNGGDYGADLLRQHHERFDHSSGRHAPRR